MFPPDYGAKVESIFIPRKFFRNKILYKYYNFCNQPLFPRETTRFHDLDSAGESAF